MLYKTIYLELLKQHPTIHDQLKANRQLLAALDHYSMELKSLHEIWKEQLMQAKPGSGPSQIASEALEIALQEMQDRLSHASLAQQNEALSLDEVMAFIRERTPPA